MKWSQHQPDRDQEAFPQCSHTHGVVLGDGAMQAQELDLMIPGGPFTLSIFCDSLNNDLLHIKILTAGLK